MSGTGRYVAAARLPALARRGPGPAGALPKADDRGTTPCWPCPPACEGSCPALPCGRGSASASSLLFGAELVLSVTLELGAELGSGRRRGRSRGLADPGLAIWRSCRSMSSRSISTSSTCPLTPHTSRPASFLRNSPRLCIYPKTPRMWHQGGLPSKIGKSGQVVPPVSRSLAGFATPSGLDRAGRNIIRTQSVRLLILKWF